jgi:hypothetical protein
MTEKQKRELEDSILDYLGLTKEEVQSWDDHDAAIANALKEADEQLATGPKPFKPKQSKKKKKKSKSQTIKLDDITITDKYFLLVNDTLDKLLTGSIQLENAKELIDLGTAVGIFNALSNQDAE